MVSNRAPPSEDTHWCGSSCASTQRIATKEEKDSQIVVLKIEFDFDQLRNEYTAHELESRKMSPTCTRKRRSRESWIATRPV